MKKCRLCKSTFVGRTDKIFCRTSCKSTYHYKLRMVNHSATQAIDDILHRNRSILLEIMGKYKRQKKVPLLLLQQKKFNFQMITRYYINRQGKTYNYVYDYAWMMFSDAEVLILKMTKP